MSRPLTILHLTQSGGGGSSVSISLLGSAQREAGHRVLLGCPPATPLAELAARRGLPVLPLEFDSTGAAARAVLATVRREDVDVVNAHSSRDRAACRRLRLTGRLRAALVMTRRAMPMSTPLSAVASGLAADRTIAVSRPVARALARRGTPPWRIAVVHNALDPARIDGPVPPGEVERMRVRIGWDRERPTLGVVARRKDHETLLRALREIPRPVTLVCAGFAPEPALERLAREAAPHRTVFLPFQDDVRALYACLDVVALPTREEGLSQGLMEAMALAKPVVTTTGGGNTDLIEDGVHGLLVRPGDWRAMGRALARVLEDAALARRLGEGARARVRGEFTIERTRAATDAVYRSALERRGLAS